MSREAYLRDTVLLLLEMATEARDAYLKKKAEKGADAAAFESGRVFGLMEAASLFYQQMASFQLEPSEHGFPKDFDAERDLLE